jgi:hypothetical protein
VPSFRWLNLLPWAILFAGLAVFVLSFMPRLRGWVATICVLVVACLHPELLMWSNTLRWYCPWTGLALMALVVFLQPKRVDWRLGWWRGVAGVILLAGMFYLNYVTLLFVAALVPALWLRVPGTERRWAGKRLLGVGVGFLLLVLPQIGTMVTVHLPNSRAQRSNVVIAGVRLVQALTGSEAFLPWNAVAVVATLMLVWLIGRGVWLSLRGEAPARQVGSVEGGWTAERALVVFGVGFALLVVATGLGGKPRNAILLVPVFAPAVGVAVERLGRWMQWAVVAVLAVWMSVGAAHLLGRFGLQKSNMNDRPEEVVRLIARGDDSAGEAGGCALAVTYDSGVAFALAQARVPRLMVLSPYRGSMFEGTLPTLPGDCAHPQLYVVQSYRSGEPDRDWKYIEELDAAKRFVEGTPGVARLSRDPDAGMKRRLSRVAGMKSGTSLPDYRFVVFSGEMDGARLPELRRTLHYFVSGEEVVPDWSEDDQSGGETNVE